jgi:SH3-like domain-containing protein
MWWNTMKYAWKTSVLAGWILLAVLGGVSLAQAERLSVKAPVANVRSGPNTTDPVIWQVEKYHPLDIIGKQGKWRLFQDFEGDRGWIHDSLLDDVKAVVVKNNKCNVRSGPGTDKTIRFTVDKGVPFKVLEKKGKWIHVMHADGDQGWIHQSLVW